LGAETSVHWPVFEHVVHDGTGLPRRCPCAARDRVAAKCIKQIRITRFTIARVTTLTRAGQGPLPHCGRRFNVQRNCAYSRNSFCCGFPCLFGIGTNLRCSQYPEPEGAPQALFAARNSSIFGTKPSDYKSTKRCSPHSHCILRRSANRPYPREGLAKSNRGRVEIARSGSESKACVVPHILRPCVPAGPLHYMRKASVGTNGVQTFERDCRVSVVYPFPDISEYIVKSERVGLEASHRMRDSVGV
jgi:hypothetical protein